MSSKKKVTDGGLEVAVWPLEKIIPYARNPRKNEAAVAKVMASLKEFGWRQPIVVDPEMVIVAGHTRYEAAKRLGWTTAPVHVASGLTPAQIKAYRLADNRTGQEAEWNNELLALELGDLLGDEFDLNLTGFDADELAALLTEETDGLTDPDEVPEAPAEPVSVLGDVWVLGKHRLVCGDSTDADVVAKCLNGAVPHLMVTDPPYGVEYDPDWRSDPKIAAAIRHPKKGAVGQVKNDDKADWREVWALFAGDVAYVWHADNKAHIVADSLIACGFDLRAQVIWGKHRFVLGRGHYHPQHEPCWYAVRKSATGHWQGDRTQATLWTVPPHQKSETGHSTQKPIECMKRPIENNSSPGQAVYEPFAGSSTTVIAAEMTGRSCHAIELSPAYVDIGVLRWQAFTGKQATLEGDGRTFDEIAAKRIAKAA